MGHAQALETDRRLAVPSKPSSAHHQPGTHTPLQINFNISLRLNRQEVKLTTVARNTHTLLHTRTLAHSY